MPDLPLVVDRARRSKGFGRAPGPVYLDYHASTPCDPRVVEAMLPFFVDVYANPSSAHAGGRETGTAVSAARAHIAHAIGCAPGEVVFTSGATESNNLAVLGAAHAAPPDRRRVLVSSVEHKAVLEPAHALRRRGFEVETIPVEHDGRVAMHTLAALLDTRTALVSVQVANNEVGTIQPIAEIAELVRASGALLHCDAAQAVGRMAVDAGAWGVDLLSLSGHKCYGPKGVGALVVRGGPRSAAIEPLMFGGGQEGGLRPGTLNVPGIVGLGRACQLAVTEWKGEASRLGQLRDEFERRLMAAIPGITRNGALDRRLAGNSSLRVEAVDADAVIANLPDVLLSTGSACTSGAIEPSHVLTAMGLTRTEARETFRVGLGRFTTAADVEYAARRIVDVIQRIRALS
jgi:cysteine desulfurase